MPRPEAADGKLLFGGAAGARVRPGRQSASRTGAGPATGYDWPQSNHGLTIDHKGNVWIGGNVGTDSHILKFTQDGKFIAQFGKPGTEPTGSNDTENFGRVAKIFVDPKSQ